MPDPTEITSSSLQALAQQYELIAHNLANANTAGYKRRLSVFSQELASRLAAGAAVGAASGGQISAATALDLTQGQLVKTDRPLDLALSGKGFFVVEGPAGPLYTRHGVFSVNPNGQLVDSAGRTLAGAGGPIIIPSTAGSLSLSVSADGDVSVGGKPIGKLQVVEFEDPSRLLPVGGNVFRAPDAVTPSPATSTTVSQGFQEAANVSTVEELVGLIQVTRMYEANLKTIAAREEASKSLLQAAM